MKPPSWVRLTSRQTDGSTAVPHHEVLRAEVDELLAEPPQAKVGCLAGLIDLLDLWAKHCPVVCYHRCEHARHSHKQHKDGNLYLGTLMHSSSWCHFCSAKILLLMEPSKTFNTRCCGHWSVSTGLLFSVLAASLTELLRFSSLHPRPVSSLPLSQICASGSNGRGPDCSVLLSRPCFPTHWKLPLCWGAASLEGQLLR